MGRGESVTLTTAFVGPAKGRTVDKLKEASVIAGRCKG